MILVCSLFIVVTLFTVFCSLTPSSMCTMNVYAQYVIFANITHDSSACADTPLDIGRPTNTSVASSSQKLFDISC